MRSTEARIIRLEDRRPKGCPTCCDWGLETWEIEFADGSDSEDRRPDVCPACRRYAPPIRRNVVVIGCRTDGPQ